MNSLFRLVSLVVVSFLVTSCSGDSGDPTKPVDPGAFSLSVSPASVTIAPGGSGELTVAVSRSGGFTGPVSVAAEGLPAGVTASGLVVAGGSTSGALTLTTAAGAGAGQTQVTLRGTTTVAGVAERTTAATVIVTAPPNPIPTLSALSPGEATAGSSGFTLTVTGDGFVEGAQVRWNGEARMTTFISTTELTALITTTDIAAAGTAAVTVLNPAPGGGPSSALSFVIADSPSRPGGIRISAGETHTCALDDDGAAWCWGQGFLGRLGHGSPADSPVPIPVAGDFTFTTISAGRYHTCAVAVGGAVWCWGNGTNGALGTGSNSDTYVPSRVEGNRVFVAVSAGSGHSCGLTDEGRAFCWGWGADGSLGNGANVMSNVPVEVAGNHVFTSISAGLRSCGVTEAGDVWCWGSEDGPSDGNAPTKIAGGAFASVAAGSTHRCGLTPEDEAWCWGWNDSGQLGDGSSVSFSNVPTRIQGNHAIAFLSAGGIHACGITTGGEGYCWGAGSDGQLGNGGTASQNVPVAVTGEHTFVQIAGGWRHSCGLTNAGEIWCWGSNAKGQLGTGTNTSSNVPVRVPTWPPK